MEILQTEHLIPAHNTLSFNDSASDIPSTFQLRNTVSFTMARLGYKKVTVILL